jgi:chromosome segregation ATPase
MAGQLEQFQSQKKALESELTELEAAEAKGVQKKWQQEKNARRSQQICSELAELQVKIENNPKHAQLAAGDDYFTDARPPGVCNPLPQSG